MWLLDVAHVPHRIVQALDERVAPALKVGDLGEGGGYHRYETV
jgi:hypothetical protein